MSTALVENKERERSVAAVAEFVALVHARERGDENKAAEALDKLRRFGFTVGVRQPTQAEGVPNG